MRKVISTLVLLLTVTIASAVKSIPFGKGYLTIKTVSQHAVRIQYTEGHTPQELPDWVYVKQQEVENSDLTVRVDKKRGILEITDKQGHTVFTATRHELTDGTATLAFPTTTDEYLFGLGQFQDGYSNLRGLSRRLTQVNTQTSIPMLLSSKGYGVLWNNYGLTNFNPCRQHLSLTNTSTSALSADTVNVTTTEGTRREARRNNVFTATLHAAQEGDYALLLDVGQKMARRHHLTIDGQTVINMQNVWLPPTASTIVHLTAGDHTVSAELTAEDQPTLYYDSVGNETVFQSPVATAVDYTVFIGTPDEIISSYRELTGQAPLPPRWALGYIHCRERFHSQDEILQNAQEFRQRQLPVDLMVQDWQYWGHHGWNSMQFDEQYYPNPRQLTDSLHRMNIRLMLSVWSKIDRNSELGKQMAHDNYYIPETDWIDFFNPEAAEAYWRNFNERLVPLGIDAWWQDATEPENDDLTGRRVNNGKWSGDAVRNIYPLLVNKTVFEGLSSNGSKRPMILTRSGFAGIQRYGAALWSGDVGNDWETFRRQLTAGLGLQAAGIPWWTYDAGGFFRPQNQYADSAYIERMERWIETAVFLPLMRVHGYMSDTEPWRYGQEALSTIRESLQLRYRLLPYIYSQAAAVTFDGNTLMRPLVFDFADDAEALKQSYEYMFGPALLISPITEPDVQTWRTYLPRHQAGWYDFYSGQHYEGGQYVTTAVDRCHIPVFVKGGSLLPLGPDRQHVADRAGAEVELRVYPGADVSFTLYDDDGETTAYQSGDFRRTTFTWDDNRRTLRTDGDSTTHYSLRIMDSTPRVFHEEHTGRHFAAPKLPAANQLPEIRELPDPLAWSDGSGTVNGLNQWERRRSEIAAQIQHYGIGTKPAVSPDCIQAKMDGDTLIVNVTINQQTLTLRAEITYPSTGKAPYALMIGTSGIALPKQLFDNRPIATMVFHEDQVNDYSQWRPHHERGEHAFDQLYPELAQNGAYSEWAWGLSRLIDGLQQLGSGVTRIDTGRIGLTGCSYAGKMALFCGAFDERIALTIAQEPGGGGAAAWRVSHTLQDVESIERTDYHWFLESQREDFSGDNVYRLPYDHHALCAMVFPRALLLLGNPDYKWLADESMEVSARAAKKIWQRFGIGERFGCDIVGGHPHCQLPECQWPIVEEFLDKFLLYDTK